MNTTENIDNETVSLCDICGSSDIEVLSHTVHVNRCQRCKYTYVSPGPSQQTISTFYSANHSYDYWLRDERIRLQVYGKRLAVVEKYKSSGRILDVGAGPGLFLSVAKERGWDVYGTEVSTLAVAEAEKHFEISLFLGQLEEASFGANSFDVVTLWHVFEHVPSPSRVLEEAKKILKNRGILVIEVPNETWYSWHQIERVFKNMLKHLLNRLPIGKRYRIWKRYMPVTNGSEIHLSYFTLALLKSILEHKGFHVRELSIGYRARLDWVTKLARKLSVVIYRLTGLNFHSTCLVVAQKP